MSILSRNPRFNQQKLLSKKEKQAKKADPPKEEKKEKKAAPGNQDGYVNLPRLKTKGPPIQFAGIFFIFSQKYTTSLLDCSRYRGEYNIFQSTRPATQSTVYNYSIGGCSKCRKIYPCKLLSEF